MIGLPTKNTFKKKERKIFRISTFLKKVKNLIQKKLTALHYLYTLTTTLNPVLGTMTIR